MEDVGDSDTTRKSASKVLHRRPVSGRVFPLQKLDSAHASHCAGNISFRVKEAGKSLNDNGKICTIVTSLLGAYTPFYSAYAGLKAPVEHFTRAASKEFGERGISVTAIGPGPMDTPFFYPAESDEAVAFHKTAAALSPFSNSGLTEIEDIVPYVRFMVSEGWWMTGQTILVNGGYTTK